MVEGLVDDRELDRLPAAIFFQQVGHEPEMGLLALVLPLQPPGLDGAAQQPLQMGARHHEMLGHGAGIDPADVIAPGSRIGCLYAPHQFVHHQAAGLRPQEHRHARRRFAPAVVRERAPGRLGLDQLEQFRACHQRLGPASAVDPIKRRQIGKDPAHHRGLGHFRRLEAARPSRRLIGKADEAIGE